MSNVENFSPQIIRRVAKEMNELSSEPPEGIRVIINEEDVTDIQAVIEGPGTFYKLPTSSASEAAFFRFNALWLDSSFFSFFLHL